MFKKVTWGRNKNLHEPGYWERNDKGKVYKVTKLGFYCFWEKKEKQALNLKCIRTYLKHVLFKVSIKASVLGHVLNKHTRG